MIQFNRKTKRSKRKLIRTQAKSGTVNTQAVLNRLLYTILLENGGALSFPVTDLDNVPPTFAMSVQVKDGQMTVIAGTQKPVEKSPLILPNDKKIITGRG